VPELQRLGQVVTFLTRHRGFDIPSTALVAPMSKAFVDGLRRYAAEHHRAVGRLRQGAAQGRRHARVPGPVRRLGAGVVHRPGPGEDEDLRTQRRRNPDTGAAYPWIVTATAVVNQFYVCAIDEDFGPFFLRFSSYFLYTGRLCVNGHEYAKRQAAKAGVAFTALDNGSAALDDPADVPAVQAISDGLTEPVSTRCCASGWPGCRTRSPRPTGPAGYRYQVSILQASSP
jgi:hypothetical protein